MLLKGIKEIGKGENIKLPVWRMIMLDTLLSFQAHPEGTRCLQDPEQALSAMYKHTQSPQNKKSTQGSSLSQNFSALAEQHRWRSIQGDLNWEA